MGYLTRSFSRKERARIRRFCMVAVLGTAIVAIVAIVGFISPETTVKTSGVGSIPLGTLLQSLDSDDSVADDILQSARRKYAAMKRLELRTQRPKQAAAEKGGDHSAGLHGAAGSKAKDMKEINAVLKGSGTADRQTLVSRLEAAIAGHKLSTRGLVEAVHEAQKVNRLRSRSSSVSTRARAV